MRPLFYTSIVLLFLSSCITSSHVHYSDPNYLGSSEFSSYKEIVTEPVSEIYQTQDTDTITDNYYSEYDVADDYYDYSFSSRIRRFHRPMYYSNYYGGLYTDYYWYNNDPFYCGTSIYYGYNWNSPYYSYYSPYYSNNYYSYYAYGHNNYHHNTPTYNYYNNNNNNHTTGHRGSLSSHSSERGVKTNTIIPNTSTSTLNIRNTITTKKPYRANTTTKTNSNRRNTSIKTNNNRGNKNVKINTNRANTTTKTNNSYRGNISNKTTTKKGNRSYTTPKSNTNKKSYLAPKSNSSKRNYNSGSSKSNRGSKSSGSSNRRSVKPRK